MKSRMLLEPQRRRLTHPTPSAQSGVQLGTSRRSGTGQSGVSWRSDETWFGKPRQRIDLPTIDVIDAITITRIDRREDRAMFVHVEPTASMTANTRDQPSSTLKQ